MFSRVLDFTGSGASCSQAEREISFNTRRTLKTQTNLPSQSLQTSLQEDFETMIGVKNISMLPTESLFQHKPPHFHKSDSTKPYSYRSPPFYQSITTALAYLNQVHSSPGKDLKTWSGSDTNCCQTLQNSATIFELLKVGLYSIFNPILERHLLC